MDGKTAVRPTARTTDDPTSRATATLPRAAAMVIEAEHLNSLKFFVFSCLEQNGAVSSSNWSRSWFVPVFDMHVVCASARV